MAAVHGQVRCRFTPRFYTATGAAPRTGSKIAAPSGGKKDEARVDPTRAGSSPSWKETTQ
jgi:hypothetical protein